MSKSVTGGRSAAERIDQFMQRTALSVFIMSLTFATSAAAALAHPPWAGYLGKLQLALSVLAVLSVLPLMVSATRRIGRMQWRACVAPESFVAETYRKACAASFKATFGFLVAVKVLSETYTLNAAPGFYLDLVLCVTLGVFSGHFFFHLNAGNDPETPDEEAV